jgi:hypothetical protein
MKKIFLVLLCLCCSFSFFGEDAFSLIPSSSDFAIELIPVKILKVKKLAEILSANPQYVVFKAVLAKKNMDFEKIVKKVVITGDYKKNNSILLDTSMKEKEFISMIEDKKPETFNLSGQKVYKYFEKNKIIFAAYIKENILIIAENPSLIIDTKRLNFNKITKEKFPQAEIQNSIARAYFCNIAKMNLGKNKNGKSLLGNTVDDGIFMLSSPNDVMLKATGYLSSNSQHEKILQIQVNALFLLLASKLSNGNQILANQITDSLEISSENGMVKVSFQLDTSLMNNIAPSKTVPEEDSFDPFAN